METILAWLNYLFLKKIRKAFATYILYFKSMVKKKKTYVDLKHILVWHATINNKTIQIFLI